MPPKAHGDVLHIEQCHACLLRGCRIVVRGGGHAGCGVRWIGTCQMRTACGLGADGEVASELPGPFGHVDESSTTKDVGGHTDAVGPVVDEREPQRGGVEDEHPRSVASKVRSTLCT